MTDADQDPAEGVFSDSLSSTKNAITAVVGATGAIIIAIMIVACAVGIPVAMLVLGAQHLDGCPAEKKIPIYLIVAGGSTLLLVPYTVMTGSRPRTNPIDKSKLQTFVVIFNGIIMTLVSLFSFAWFVCGSIWVFRTYRPNMDDENSAGYCDRATYLFSFSLLIIAYVCIFVSCCCSFCFKRRSQYGDVQ